MKKLPGALKGLERAQCRAFESQAAVEVAMAEVGEAIRHDRMQRKVGLRALARKIAIGASYLSDIERGNRFPSTEVLERIKKALAVTSVR